MTLIIFALVLSFISILVSIVSLSIVLAESKVFRKGQEINKRYVEEARQRRKNADG